MKKILLAALLVMTVTCLQAKKPVLSFDNNGEFKILQLTDCHMKYELPDIYAKTLARIDHIMTEEKPDVVVFTGDIVTGERSTREAMWKIVLKQMDSYRTPYVIVYGNHDPEGKEQFPRPQMSKIIATGKYDLNTLNEAGELADIRIPVMAHDGSRPMFDMYLLDSRDYAENYGYTGLQSKYAWFSQAQVNWLRNECMAATAANGGVNVPSMAFFHIPLCEYAEASAKGPVIGVRGETESSGTINSGMFAAMFETGNVMGVFVGHDHNSNYIACHCGIALGFGGFSGDDTTYNQLAHGFRVIVVKEGERAFRTWIHDEDDRIQLKAEYKDGQLTKVR